MKKLVILLSLVVAPAYAETINITLPVKVENLMPTINQVKVECRLYSAKPPAWGSSDGLVASWTAKLPVDQAGKVQQILQPTINTNPGKADPTYYQCGFQLGKVDGSWIEPDPSSALDEAKARQGTAFHPREEGSITQQIMMQKKQ